jgi:hypothetical protein
VHDATLTLRPAKDADRPAIARLVEMEEADALAGEVLVAELDGYVIAALSVAGNRAVADIFRPTAGIVRLLRERREQLIATREYSFSFAAERPRRVRRVGLWRAPVPA